MNLEEIKQWFVSKDGTEINDLSDYYIDWLIAEVERLSKTEYEEDAIHEESDGCPTENAVLKRDWRKLRAEVERLEAQIRTMYTEEQVRKHGEFIATRCAEIAKEYDSECHCFEGCDRCARPHEAIRKEFNI